MPNSHLSVQEICKSDIIPLVNYWMNASDDFLKGLGVDLSKLPSREDFTTMIESQIATPYEEKKSFALIWFYDDVPVGHSNISPILFGEEANVHLHIWDASFRGKGFGLDWLKKSLPLYFHRFKLKRIFCEPYALNPGPHKIVEKLGFELVKEYTTVPGWICFEQPVKRWLLTREKFDSLYHV